MWNRTALKQHLRNIPVYGRIDLTNALANIAYFIKTGPFRSIWVRYGIDPRRDKSLRIYQLLDFRSFGRRERGDGMIFQMCDLQNMGKLDVVEEDVGRELTERSEWSIAAGRFVNSLVGTRSTYSV